MIGEAIGFPYRLTRLPLLPMYSCDPMKVSLYGLVHLQGVLIGGDNVVVKQACMLPTLHSTPRSKSLGSGLSLWPHICMRLASGYC